jgi:hypothetical protein
VVFPLIAQSKKVHSDLLDLLKWRKDQHALLLQMALEAEERERAIQEKAKQINGKVEWDIFESFS